MKLIDRPGLSGFSFGIESIEVMKLITVLLSPL